MLTIGKIKQLNCKRGAAWVIDTKYYITKVYDIVPPEKTGTKQLIN